MGNEQFFEQLRAAIWAAKSLFDRNKLSGSAGNISIRSGDRLYISRSGSCFGCLSQEDFSEADLAGRLLSGPKPSKELPLHAALYRLRPEIGAVIHTHSPYATLWSCLEHDNEIDCIPTYTPYLRMKVGTVGLVPYAPPGSPELFERFEKAIPASGAYLLKNHGPVVGGKDVMDAFYALEELEESAKLAFLLKDMPVKEL